MVMVDHLMMLYFYIITHKGNFISIFNQKQKILDS